MAFLYNNLRLSGNRLRKHCIILSRTCHHVGLVSLAVIYYPKGSRTIAPIVFPKFLTSMTADVTLGLEIFDKLWVL
ncbi:hypothetical protein HAX54_009839 [Datura stramonium]|uniref:Uncharacterized protein n=1 Tax=Datura stramonium TaxID=4076 RepID=A0ABS8THZ3_DATST|nr:hypothetical protein [Datura stramonium]